MRLGLAAAAARWRAGLEVGVVQVFDEDAGEFFDLRWEAWARAGDE